METTAIIPAFNEEIYIGSIIIKTKNYADHIIVVDDGSTDGTAELAQLAGAEVVRYVKTRGKTDAIKTGIQAALKNGTEIVIISVDNKYHNDIIPDIINYIRNNDCDMVVASLDDGERAHLLNKKENIIKEKYLILTIDSLNKIDLKHLNGLFIRELLNQAKEKGLKIKYIDLKRNKFDEFNGYNIGVVVPAYNEEQFIKETIDGIPKYIKSIYVVDDGSKDRTSEIVKDIKDSRILLVRHERNKGVGASIVTGYKLALRDDIDIVTVMGGDNQMDPDKLPHLLMPIIDGYADYTKGNRLINKDFRKGMSKWRSFGNAILTIITKIGSGYWHIMDPQNGYTAISKKALEAIDLDSIYTYYGYCNDMLIKLNTIGMRAEDVLIPARYGNERSKIRYSKYIAKVAPMIFKGFLWRLKTKYMILDFHPLVFFYFAGMILSPAGILFGVWILYQKIYHNPVSPNFPLLAAFITLTGLQLLLFAMFFDMQANKSRRMECNSQYG